MAVGATLGMTLGTAVAEVTLGLAEDIALELENAIGVTVAVGLIVRSGNG